MYLMWISFHANVVSKRQRHIIAKRGRGSIGRCNHGRMTGTGRIHHCAYLHQSDIMLSVINFNVQNGTCIGIGVERKSALLGNTVIMGSSYMVGCQFARLSFSSRSCCIIEKVNFFQDDLCVDRDVSWSLRILFCATDSLQKIEVMPALILRFWYLAFVLRQKPTRRLWFWTDDNKDTILNPIVL